MNWKKLGGSLLRHSLTFGGGALTMGVAGPELIPVGGILTTIGVGLSARDKQKQEERERKALATMPPNVSIALTETRKTTLANMTVAELRAELERRALR